MCSNTVIVFCHLLYTIIVCLNQTELVYRQTLDLQQHFKLKMPQPASNVMTSYFKITLRFRSFRGATARLWQKVMDRTGTFLTSQRIHLTFVVGSVFMLQSTLVLLNRKFDQKPWTEKLNYIFFTFVMMLPRVEGLAEIEQKH